MRALKVILVILAVLAAILVVLGLVGPKSYRVERSTVLKAPVEAVYPQVSSLRNMQDWSPWKEKDPDAKMSLEGTDGAVGSSMSWDGNDKVGKGKQEITELVPNKSVRTVLTFIEPFESKSNGTIDLEAMGDSTKVTWGMQGDNNFVSRIMCVFMNMDKMVGPDFDNGLGKLKTLVDGRQAVEEAERAEVLNAFRFATADRPATLYVGTRETVKWVDMDAFFAKNMPAAFAAIGKAKVKPSGPASGVYFKWDVVNKSADVLAGAPIPADAKGKVQGFTEYEMPASKSYTIVYTGPYSGMKKPHDAMAVKMKMDKVSLNEAVIEEYISNPMTEKDSTKLVTNIIYLVK